MKKPRFLWITDPWDTLDHAKDTTLRLAQESLRLGFESHWADYRSIRWENGKTWIDACRVTDVPKNRAPESPERVEIRLDPPRRLSPSAFTSLHYRVDPPVDLAYLHPLQILALAFPDRGERAIVNPPSVLTLENEKLTASALGKLMPPSIAASRWDDLVAFGIDRRKTILKPLHQAQSKGVELIDWTTAQGRVEARARIVEATDQFRRPVIQQSYLAGVLKGERRLWFVDGKLLASVLKIPANGTYRIDMDRGATLAERPMGAKDKKAALEIGKHLRKLRVRLAAVDLIEGYVTDFNFTSPGLLTGMEKLLKRNLAEQVLKSLARD